VSDGGIAFILTTADRAKDRPKPPVYVLGQGFGEVSADLWWEKMNFTHMAVPRARDQAFGLLRMASQNSNRKLHDVALEVTETGALPAITGDRPRRAPTTD